MLNSALVNFAAINSINSPAICALLIEEHPGWWEEDTVVGIITACTHVKVGKACCEKSHALAGNGVFPMLNGTEWVVGERLEMWILYHQGRITITAFQSPDVKIMAWIIFEREPTANTRVESDKKKRRERSI